MGIGLRGPGGVHVGHHRGDPQGRVEKGEERKRRKVDLIRAEVEMRADLPDLGLEGAVGVDGALGRPGAAGRKQDGRHVAAPGLCDREGRPLPGAQLCQRRPAPEPAAAHGDPVSHGLEDFPENASHRMRQRDADKGLRPCGAEACQHAADPHAGVDDHRHRTHFENGEHERKELDARPHHQDGARARTDSGFEQPVGDLVGVPVELLEAQVSIGDSARGIAAGRADHGAFEGMGLRHDRKMAGHVHASLG